MSKRKTHRWGDKVEFPLAHKTERSCVNGCGITKVSRHEHEGGHDRYWTEFWRGEERIHCEGAPPCAPRCEASSAEPPAQSEALPRKAINETEIPTGGEPANLEA